MRPITWLESVATLGSFCWIYKRVALCLGLRATQPHPSHKAQRCRSRLAATIFLHTYICKGENPNTFALGPLRPACGTHSERVQTPAPH